MIESNQTFKRLPTFRVHIKDLQNGVYNQDHRLLYTIYGPLKRIRICGTILNRNIINEPSELEDDDMIKSGVSSKSRISFLINDGTGTVWAFFWGVEEKYYEQINEGNSICLTGKVRESNGKISITGEIIRNIKNPNEILLHELETIRFLKKNGIFNVYDKNQNKEYSQRTMFSDGNLTDKELDFDVEQIIPKRDLEDFDEWDNDLSDIDDSEVEERVYNLIKSMDQGDGVSFKEIVNNLEIDKTIIEDILKKLCLNTRIYNTYDDSYKIFED